VRLEPPDLSSFIKAKLSAWPAKSSDLHKSVDVTNQSSPLKIPFRGSFVDSALKNDYSGSNQSTTQIMTFIRSLGLPQDALSSSLISFFKFFSLPLDSSVLKQIRREVLESKSGNGKSADSAALAASAAFDKGVHLSDEALSEYAAAIDPAERRDEQSSPENNGGAGFDQSSSNQSASDHHQKRNTEEKSTPLPEDIHNLMDEIDASDSFLGYVNKIPGKNGKKWIVLPFNFVSGAIEFSVSVRILIDTNNDFNHSVERLAVDVVSNGLVNERRWFFFISKAQDAFYRAQIAVSPNLHKTEQSLLLTELKEMLGNFVSDISFIDESVILSFIDSRNDSIISVDEEV
jgi:hypothetical protein